MRIVIDSGHDAIADNKNIGTSGVYKEYAGNWEYTQKLARHLKDCGFEVILCRSENTGMSLSKRSRVAIDNKADIFISIHSDAFSTNQAKGSTMYRSINRPKDKAIAEQLIKVVSESYGTINRGVKTRESTTRPTFDYYTVIDVAANYKKLVGGDFEVPHVFLLEREFHTNILGEQNLLDENVSDKSAKDLAEKLAEIFDVKPIVVEPIIDYKKLYEELRDELQKTSDESNKKYQDLLSKYIKLEKEYKIVFDEKNEFENKYSKIKTSWGYQIQLLIEKLIKKNKF